MECDNRLHEDRLDRDDIVIPFAGPSYQLVSRKADAQRAINLFVQKVESGSGRATYIMKSIPGLRSFLPLGGEIRWMEAVGDRLFVVAGSGLWEIGSDAGTTSRGTLDTTTGPIGMAFGIDQLVIVDGPGGYVLTLATNAFAPITSGDFYGSRRVDYLNGRFIFCRPGTQQFYESNIEDALSFNPLYFASAERSPDALLAPIVDHGEVLLFGQNSVEVWSPADNGNNLPLARNDSAVIEVGTDAPFSIQRMNGSVFWLGRDRNGSIGVYMMNGYNPQRVSTRAVEEALIKERPTRAADLAAARAYTYQLNGGAFYCLRVPGVETSWCFDAATQLWHEQAELVNGEYAPHRNIAHAYIWGKHIVGGDDGGLYEQSESINSNAGDVLVRDRVSPHSPEQDLEPKTYPFFELDATSGEAPSGIDPQVLMRYSDDGGRNFGRWQARGLGKIGEYNRRVRWLRQGQARDRVWQVRMTDDAPFSIIGANA